jgi:CBS domain-containing protein
VGSVKIDDVGKIARDDRVRQTAGDILRDDSEVRRITPDTPVLDALNRMQEQNTSRLVVTDGDKPVGIVTMRDVMTCLAIRREVDTGPARS